MHWDTPALVFIGTVLAVGGACLSFLKAKYHTTDHHLMIFVLIGSIGYLAPLHMKRASELEQEKLKRAWVGTARSYGYAVERLGIDPATFEANGLQRTLAGVTTRLEVPVSEIRMATLVTKKPDQSLKFLTINLLSPVPMPARGDDACRPMVDDAFKDRESWCEERNGAGKTTRIACLIPVRNKNDVIDAVLTVNFSVTRWIEQQQMAEWRVAGEFLGLLSICLLMGGFLITTAETRRRKDMERAVEPLKEELESLGGMVNAVEGVMWERPSNAKGYTFVSQQAEGYFGYDMDRWRAEGGFLENIIHPEDLPRVKAAWEEAASNCSVYHLEYRVKCKDGETASVTEHGQAARVSMHVPILRGIIVDITVQREAEASMKNMHRMMVEASRQAGMAEIATGVLHNVGNVLNSLNVGAKLLSERLRRSRFERLCQATTLLKEHLPNDMDFFVKDKRGIALPGYLDELATYLRDEQNRLTASVGDMIERIDHIRDMIMLQQSHSTVRTLWEALDLATVMEDALRLEAGVNITHESVKIERQYADLPPVYLAKGLLLQILVNLTSNACQAMADLPPEKRRLILRIVPHGADRVRIVVEDNGCGIQPRDLTTIFTQGFTTKTDGHGFGLHHACLLAEDMEGTLRAESDGLGKGARFILDLPARNAPTAPPSPSPSTSPSTPATLSTTSSSEGTPTLP
jgi:PAS domain S-box-containing protein